MKGVQMSATLQTDKHKPKASASKQKVRFGLLMLFVILVLPGLPLLIASDWTWPSAWILFSFQSIGFIFNRAILWRIDPDLFFERQHSLEHQDTARFDAIILKVYSLLSVLFSLAIGLERRYQTEFDRNSILIVTGTFMLAIGYCAGTLALLQNRYFSGTVRIQTERGHHVVSNGIYSIVRHPGYAGVIIYYWAALLLAGGWVTAIIVLLISTVFIVRTHLEDRFLQQKLTGYREYCQRTKYRLLPGVW